MPLALEKVEGPATTLEFLGILLDTVRIEARLSPETLQRIYQEIITWLDKRSATKRQILSLVGLLQHAAKVVCPGRTFVGRMYSVAAKVKDLDFYTRLNKDFLSDLYWWYTFITKWNCTSFISPLSTPQATIQTDVWGCGAFWQGAWFQWQWPKERQSMTIMAKEMVPIVLSCAVWGRHLSRKTVIIQCDNTGVVAAVRKGSSKEAMVMCLLRYLWFFVAYYDINITIPGASNEAADNLSRFNMHSFFLSNPQANLLPAPLPQEFMLSTDPTGHPQTSGSCSAVLLTGSSPIDLQAVIKRYLSFCQDASKIALPSSEEALLMFVSHLALIWLRKVFHTQL